MHDNFQQPADHEAKMARADLFKLAQYSFKLFKMIQEDQELEGWVQAKITKAADYIASVYHYMEYEMKISEYGSNIENSDMYSESIRRAFAQKLTEAKKQAVKAKDEMKKKEKALDEEKSSTGGEITRSKGVTRHKHNPDRFSDEPHTEPASKAKSKSAAEKAGDKAHDKAQEKDSKAWGKANPGKQTIMKGGVKSTNEGIADVAKKVGSALKSAGSKALDKLGHGSDEDMIKDLQKKVGMPQTGKKPMAVQNEAKKAKKDYDKDGKVESEKDEVIGSRRKAAGLDEAKKEKEPEGTYSSKRHETDGQRIARLAKEKRQAQNKERMKNDYNAEMERESVERKFDPLKHVKNPTKGEKDAAKDVKRGSYADRAAMLRSAEADGRLKEGKGKPDFLDMDKDGNKKEPMKKAVADKKKNPFVKK